MTFFIKLIAYEDKTKYIICLPITVIKNILKQIVAQDIDKDVNT